MCWGKIRAVNYFLSVMVLSPFRPVFVCLFVFIFLMNENEEQLSSDAFVVSFILDCL